MHQQTEDLPPEKLEMIRAAFEHLVRNHAAVSSHHRTTIATRVIVAARYGFDSTDELIALANALENDLTRNE